MSKRDVNGVVLNADNAEPEPSEEDLFGGPPPTEESEEESVDAGWRVCSGPPSEFVQEATEEQKARRAKAVQDKRETVRKLLDRMLSTQAEVTKLDLRIGNDDMFVPSLDRNMFAVQESVQMQVQRLRDARDAKINDIGRFRAAITLMVE